MSESRFSFTSHSEADTERFGQALASVLAGGAVIALNGPLGAGKTRLVQATSTALGVDRSLVVSPTFVLVHEYAGRHPVIHMDTYRLRDEDEFAELGVHEYFQPPNIVFIEWADRMARLLPENRLDITIEVLDTGARSFSITGPNSVVEQLRALV